MLKLNISGGRVLEQLKLPVPPDEFKESQQSLDDVLRIAAHIKPASLACYEVIPGVTSHQELGRWLVEHDRLEDKVPETLRPYLDYRSIGIDYCNSHEGEFLADSYTGIQSGAMEQVLEPV